MIQPVDLPWLRNDMLRFNEAFGVYINGNYIERYGQEYYDEGISEKAIAKMLAESESTRLRMAELFYVTTNMLELAKVAARSMPKFSLQQYDLPSDYGIVYLESPLLWPMTLDDGKPFIKEIDAFVWGPYRPQRREIWRGGRGVWVSYYVDKRSDVYKQNLTPEEIKSLAERDHLIPDLMWESEGLIPFSEQIQADPRHPETDWVLETLTCLWTLMKQPVVSNTFAHFRKSVVKNMRNQNMPEPKVRVIDLRRISHPDAVHQEGTGREYSHQWIVRGHWRQQWYPSINDHRPVWIEAHPAGPKDKPFSISEKVSNLKR